MIIIGFNLLAYGKPYSDAQIDGTSHTPSRDKIAYGAVRCAWYRVGKRGKVEGTKVKVS